jgi:hypothetical protein
VNALSPLSRAIFKQAGQQAGLWPPIAPQVWTLNWHVHSQANPHGVTSVKSLAPSVFKVAISNRRIVSLLGRTGTFADRQPGSSRPRTVLVKEKRTPS